ncbi:MAG: lysophospholipid acyltransferase family protein [Kiritimatiellaeota bacterium]|nr:lysophospholipid acyltransferase family protein [Kiritimatiellota bacterium]
MKNFLYFLQYLGVLLLWLPFQLVPDRRVHGFGASLGWAWFWLSKKRRKTAVNNILGARITADPREARRIACRAAMNFTGHILEATRFSRAVGNAPWDTYANTAGMAGESLELLRQPGPVLLVCPHLGAWEVATRMAAAFKPVTVVARTLNNPHIQKLLSGGLLRGHLEVVPKHRGLTKDVIRRWTSGGRALGILCDQHAGRHGIWVDFMGRPASTFTSPARLHLMTGHPVVLGAFIRTGPFRYDAHTNVLRFAPTGDDAADIRACTEEINRRLETLIRRFPEQYLWSHRRWREPPKECKM